MSMMDPIADMLTRIRNANHMYKEKVDVPFSKLKLEITRILSEEGFIRNYKVVEEKGRPAWIRISLKYSDKRERVISAIERVSRSGKRVYSGKTRIPKIIGGMGVAILSTSKGLLTDQQARQQGVGGEVLCLVH
ncbi:MAG TPA: 30S ribosomal protein S8 [bacterium]|nr:30S ribosomal protein S8 [bacterium]